MTGRTRFVAWAGLGVVLAAAAVLSFDALRGLALAVTIPGELAWLLPIAVDAGAAVSCAAWLSGQVSAEAARFARTMTWALLGTTVIANAGQLGMHAYGITPPWWVAVLVGAIPPAVVGGTVHLAVLVGREGGASPSGVRPESVAAPVGPLLGTLPEGFPDRAGGLTDDDPLAAVREIVAGGGGRGTVAAELGITPAQARGLIEKVKAA